MRKKHQIEFSEEDMLRNLYLHNPWWLKKPITENKLKLFKRLDYYKIIKRLEDKEILALTGPRQVGKTTLVYQLIDKLLNSNIKPQNILFITLDDPLLGTSTFIKLSKSLDVYATNILKEPLNEATNKVYAFLDEIQSIDDWEVILKRWYDLGYNIKFVVTGSSSTSIRDRASEALVGRIFPQIILPMKFLEYIRFEEHIRSKEEVLDELLRSNSKSIRTALINLLIKKGRLDTFIKVVDTEYKKTLPYRDTILVYLNQYLLKGGYPQVANTQDMTIAGQQLATYVNLTIYRDIIRTRSVRDPVALENLFAILSKGPSIFLNRANLSNTLGLKKETLNTYLFLLKNAFLISEVEFYSESRSKRSRRERKLLVNDIGIRNVSASVFDDQILTNPTEMGKIVETVVADHTRRLRYNLQPISSPLLFYWKRKYEVDFVINPFNRTLPIEVKYRENIQTSDLKGINSFREEFKPVISIIITKDLLSVKDSILFIPLWFYLIFC